MRVFVFYAWNTLFTFSQNQAPLSLAARLVLSWMSQFLGAVAVAVFCNESLRKVFRMRI